ncbi:ABC transporter permease [Niallia oryzisoli]|uniref:ABC transporter permease n=1 Tax=Niallia oryzisoli TaxID=1737571 RepID=A0ABZ2CP51_9BACI
MSSLAILFNRLLQDFRFQYKVVKMVLDWTVLLYIVVPGLVIAGFIYRSWWVDLPAWGEFVYLPIIAVFIYFISWTSRYRTFVKEADEVFLLKHKLKYFNLKKWSYLYSLIKSTISIIIAVIVALPFLTSKYSLSFSEIICFMLLFVGFSFCIMAIKMILSSYWTGWIEKLLLFGIFVLFLVGTIILFSNYVFVPVYFIGISFLFTAMAFILVNRRFHTTRYFLQEITKENEERLRFINLIFGASPGFEKQKIIKRKQPLLFPQSQKIFMKNLAPFGFYELFIKIILRNTTYFGGYFKLLGVTAFAIMTVPPLYLKLFILIGFSFFIWIWVGYLWDKVILSNPIGKQYRNHDAFFSARKKAEFYLTLPAICILSVILIVNLILLS